MYIPLLSMWPTINWTSVMLPYVYIPWPHLIWHEITVDGIMVLLGNLMKMPVVVLGLIWKGIVDLPAMAVSFGSNLCKLPSWICTCIMDLPVLVGSLGSNLFEGVHNLICNIITNFKMMNDAAASWIRCNMVKNPYVLFCKTTYLHNAGKKLDHLEEYTEGLDANSETQHRLLLEFLFNVLAVLALMALVWVLYLSLGKDQRSKKHLTPQADEDENRIKITVTVDPAEVANTKLD